MPELRLDNSIVDDRYFIQRCFVRGSYAEIFLARNTPVTPGALANGADDLVIIKALNTFLQGTPDPDLERTLVENFQNEAVALDKVRHSNIIRRLGHGTACDLDGTPFHYLVLEYLPGGDLLSLCREHPVDLQAAIFYFKQVSEALAYAHSQRVIHRDIKPNNLLLSADRRTVKIADFGVAKIASGQDSEITRVGTNVYAPPEHHPDSQTSTLRQPLTPSADIYSLAKTIYTAMTGRAPHQFQRRPITNLPEPLAAAPYAGKLLAVLERATESDVAARYESIQKFWDDFTAVDSMVGDNPEFPDADATLVRPRLSGGALPSDGIHAQNIPIPLPRSSEVPLSNDPRADLLATNRALAWPEPENVRVPRPSFQPQAGADLDRSSGALSKARIVIHLPESVSSRQTAPGTAVSDEARTGSSPEFGAGLPVGAADSGSHGGDAAPREPSLVPDQVLDQPRPVVQVNPAGESMLAAQPQPLAKAGAAVRTRKDINWVEWFRRSFVGFLVAALIGLVASTYLYFADPSHHFAPWGALPGLAAYKDGAIDNAPNVNIHSDPNGDVLTSLPAGTRVRVLEVRGGWMHVKVLQWAGPAPNNAPDGGWVDRRFVHLD